jgi:hypothetical protein
MVRINAYHLRVNKEGKQFVALELQGDLEMIQGSESGRFYATAKKCTVSSTFTEDVAKSLLGKQLPGRIDRVETVPYDYTVKETGEVISLAHTYVYVPEDKPLVLEKPARAMVGV